MLHPPRLDLLPVAVRSAERIRGTLVPCGPGLRGIGWPETPRVRATALAPWLRPQHVAVGMTAAWVWGAARSPGHPLHVSMLPGHRRNPAESAANRAVTLRIREHDFVRLEDVAVARPGFVVEQLLHDLDTFDRSRQVACRLLMLADGLTITELRRSLAIHPRPRGRISANRLEHLYGAEQ